MQFKFSTFFLALLGVMSIPLFADSVKLSADDAMKRLVKRVEPELAEWMAPKKLQGSVVMNIVVDETGTVTKQEIVEGFPLLVPAALQAVKRWKFEPLVVKDKPISFTTTVTIQFSAGIPDEEHQRELELARNYFPKSDECRDLLRSDGGDLIATEATCREALAIAIQLPDHRALEKMGAHQSLGLALFNQEKFQSSNEQFRAALAAVQTQLDDEDVEMGYVFRDLGMSYHGMGRLAEALDFYSRAAKTIGAARSKIGDEDMKKRYRTSLKQVLRLHVAAAKEAGRRSEATRVQQALNDLE